MNPGESHSRKRQSTGHPYAPETPPSKIRQHDELSVAGDQSGPGTSRAVDPQQTLPQALDEEHVARIRSEWRHCQNLNDFAELTGLDAKDLNSALGFLWWRASLRSNTFTVWIKFQAETYLSVVRTALESHNDASGIRWPKPQLSDETVDDGIAIYVELMKIDYEYHPDNIDAYTRILRQLLPVERDSFREQADLQMVEMRKAAAEAFHQRPVPGRDVVGPIFETIREYYGKFNSHKHFAPYTSLAGPSGVGKSYVVQLLAKELNVFVVYISLARKYNEGYLAREYHEGYPARSAIANKIDEFDKRERMTTFFECFLAANMSFVKLCKEHGITPGAFYDLQVMEEHYEFQTRLATHVVTLFERVCCDGIPHYDGRPREKSEYTKSQKAVDKGEFDHQEYVNRHIVWFEQHVRDDFVSISSELEKKTEYDQQMELDPSDDVPSAVVCMDEARELFYRSSDPQMRFLAFRRAMRHRSRYSANRDTKSFFALMLDTSAQVSDFSPPWSHDHSAKSLSMRPPLDPEMMIEQHRPDMLFPPIYKIDSMDVFSVEDTPAPDEGRGDGQDFTSRLFRLGRPLWGSLLRSRGIPYVLNLAAQKIRGGPHQRADEDPDTKLLALMSYRLGFYIALPTLAESLSSGYLRYIVGINDRRTLLRTYQPSEPILAHASAQETFRQPDMRLAVIRAVHTNIMNGVIHIGDIGETIAALILLFTQDRLHGTGYPRPVSLGQFLCSLLPLGISGDMENRVATSKQMGKLWEHGRVMFNHFVRVSENPTREKLRESYERGAAIFPPFGFKGADIIIPVALPRGQVSFLVIQIKNRRDDSMTSDLKNEARGSLTSAAQLLDSKIPHVAVMMSLRADGEKEAVQVIEPAENLPGPGTRKKISHGSSTYIWESQKRLLIAAVGTSLNIYPGIGFSNDPERESQTQAILEIFKSLLNCTGEMRFPLTDEFFGHLCPLG